MSAVSAAPVIDDVLVMSFVLEPWAGELWSRRLLKSRERKRETSVFIYEDQLAKCASSWSGACWPVSRAAHRYVAWL